MEDYIENAFDPKEFNVVIDCDLKKTDLTMGEHKGNAYDPKEFNVTITNCTSLPIKVDALLTMFGKCFYFETEKV